MSAGHRSAAVLAAQVARRKMADVATSIEAARWPKMVVALASILEALELLLDAPNES
jgi:hypothetical protein